MPYPAVSRNKENVPRGPGNSWDGSDVGLSDRQRTVPVLEARSDVELYTNIMGYPNSALTGCWLSEVGQRPQLSPDGPQRRQKGPLQLIQSGEASAIQSVIDSLRRRLSGPTLGFWETICQRVLLCIVLDSSDKAHPRQSSNPIHCDDPDGGNPKQTKKRAYILVAFLPLSAHNALQF